MPPRTSPAIGTSRSTTCFPVQCVPCPSTLLNYSPLLNLSFIYSSMPLTSPDHRRAHSSASSTSHHRPSQPSSPKASHKAQPSHSSPPHSPASPSPSASRPQRLSPEELLKRIVSPGSELFKYQPRYNRPSGQKPTHVRTLSEEMNERRHPSSFQQLEKVSNCRRMLGFHFADMVNSWEKAHMRRYGKTLKENTQYR